MAGYVLYKSTHPETKKKLKCSLHLAYWDLRMGCPHPKERLWCLLSRSVTSDSCDPLDHSPPGSSVHGILQARIMEWVDIPFSRGSS